MVEDWLALPAPAEPSRLSAADLAVARADAAVVDVEDPPPPAEPLVPVAPPGVEDRNSLVARTWASLTKRQRIFLEAFEECNFNTSATLRKLGDHGPGRMTVTRWKREPDFAFMVRVMKAKLAAEAIEKEDIIANAVHIREQALEPKPILYQGEPTGFDENEPEIALRANEQLAKIGGHLKQDDGPVRGEGPALVIQVVQKDGGMIDVTPKGVTIELPAPGGT